MRVRLALAVTVASWASAFVFIRVAAQEYDVGAFLFLRFALPAVPLALLASRTGGLLPAPARRVPALALGLLFAAYLGFLIAGERTVDAGTASMLAETSPLLAAVLAAVFLGERARPQLFVGLAVGFAGAGLIALGGKEGLEPSAGVLLILIAAIAQAAMLVVQRPMLRHQSAIGTVAQASVVGTVLTLPFVAQAVENIREAPLDATLSIAALTLTTGAVSYVTLAYALARAGHTGSVSAVLYVVPPVSILFGWVFLRESPSVLAIVGGAVALVGVAIATRTRPAADARAVDSTILADEFEPDEALPQTGG
jgi:drug/metabolite transporter (DMT)-like permease